jgi:hypothetical protein
VEEKIPRIKDDFLLGCKYINHANALSRLESLVNASLCREGNQSKYLIGIVQATLSGKTKLLIESSMQNLVLIISFKSTNTAFHHALKPSIDHHSLDCTTFTDRQFHNRMIMLKVRYFFMAYLDFALLFKRVICDNKPWREVTEQYKRVFQALLLNGGGYIVEDLYRRRLAKLENVQHDQVADLKSAAIIEFGELVKELNYPWFALDECHVPDFFCRGILFHSDYETVKATPEQILQWQRYEQYPQDYRSPPEGYPYSKATTLFFAFRYLIEEFLITNNIMTILASTYFSCWDSLLDKSLYSRDKPDIIAFSDLPLLGHEDVMQLFQSLQIDPAFCADERVMKAALLWEGRPGFFFELCLPKLQLLDRPVQLTAFLDTLNNAKSSVDGFLAGNL